MSGESPGSRNPAGHSGLLENALALLNAAVEFFETPVCALCQGIQVGAGADLDLDRLAWSWRWRSLLWAMFS